MDKKYDVVIVGSGLGGLVSGLLLAKEGKSVCVLEKNNQYGGNLQTFVRNKSIFDTGIHYIGGLGENENLYQYFNYLEIFDDLKLKKLDENNFDVISFGDDEVTYPFAQGYDNFVTTLLSYFPNSKSELNWYVAEIQRFCNSFPFYAIDNKGEFNQSLLEINAFDYINENITDKKLVSVLLGNNLLYAGIKNTTPFYVHALSINSYILSSWRCIHGGSQITKALIKQLRKHKADLFKYKEVNGFVVENDNLKGVRTKCGQTYLSDLVVSNIEVKTTIKWIGEQNLRKSFYNRIQKLEPTISSFSIFIVCKPETIPYLNYNMYHSDSFENVYESNNKMNLNNWPNSYMISMNINHYNQKWADCITGITYLDYEEVKKWENTFNTVYDKSERDASYHQFKLELQEKFLNKIAEKIPNIRESIVSITTASPLSYRDYIGNDKGNLYGFIKDCNNPLMSMIPTNVKYKNLFLTGQSVNMHGVLGVTVGAVKTCSEILGSQYLLDKIRKKNNVV
jgi:all-trans-retinol 13,14-reductase